MTSRPFAHPRRAGPLIAAGIAVAAVVAALAGCSASQASKHPAAAAGQASPFLAPAPSPAASVGARSSRPACVAAGRGFTCAMRRRIAAAQRFLATRPGLTGIVLRDRTTGAVWRNKYAGTQVYMASTSKLAMVITLLVRDHAGAIRLSSADRSMIHEMLHVSSDSAADDLWFKYGATFYTHFFPKVGLAAAHYLPQAGVSGAYWGEITCPATDLDRMVNYLLDDLPATLRDYVVGEMRDVAAVQHFGVWGAGAQNEPGNKDGWSTEKPGWIIDSAGFAGLGARYTLAMMNSLNGQGGYRDGTETITQVAALLFQGRRIPMPAIQATP